MTAEIEAALEAYGRARFNEGNAAGRGAGAKGRDAQHEANAALDRLRELLAQGNAPRDGGSVAALVESILIAKCPRCGNAASVLGGKWGPHPADQRKGRERAMRRTQCQASGEPILAQHQPKVGTDNAAFCNLAGQSDARDCCTKHTGERD